MSEWLRYKNPSLTVQLPILLAVWICRIIKRRIRDNTRSQLGDSIEMYRNSHYGFRARLLVENGVYISNTQYELRKASYLHKETGFFVLTKNNKTWKETMKGISLPEFAVAFKEHVFYSISQSIIWLIVYSFMKNSFAGVLPFKIPHGYKTILQIGINMKNLSSSYVSALSWYLAVVYLIEDLDGLSQIIWSSGSIFGDFFITKPRFPHLSIGVDNNLRFPISTDLFDKEMKSLESFKHYFQPHLSEFQALGVLNKLTANEKHI